MRVTRPAWRIGGRLCITCAAYWALAVNPGQAASDFLAPFHSTQEFAWETVALMQESKSPPPKAVENTGDGTPRLSMAPSLPRPRGGSGRPRGLVRYEKYIAEAARQFAVDPNLIKAVILVESGGDPLAVSPKNARGLMQVLPATARELGVLRVGDLFHPRTNILVGTRYLASLIAQSNGNIARALASYNAGPGGYQAEGIVPAETQAYVPRVLRLRAQLVSSDSRDVS